VLRAKLGARISLPFCLLGSYAPDMATKWLVYGVSLGGDRLRIGDPMQFHRGWPGVGFTHSYSFGALVSMLIFAVSKNRVFAFSFLIGQWLHTTSDMLDSVGVMALFPFSTMHVSTDTYQYAGELGRLNDAHAYYTSLGGICDLAFVILLIPYWRVLTQDYFTREVIDSDPAFTSTGVSPSCTQTSVGLFSSIRTTGPGRAHSLRQSFLGTEAANVGRVRIGCCAQRVQDAQGACNAQEVLQAYRSAPGFKITQRVSSDASPLGDLCGG
jgi:membrane-bound metal-dependent hydrolase YbcI (DUF457 family)